MKIRDIVYLNEQETIKAEIPDSRGVRLDVYVEDDQNTVYDVDVQTTSNTNLPKRMRMYQSMIDVRALEEGDDYQKLKKSFVIFITNYDPFGAKRYVYTFRSRCDEDNALVLNDAAVKLVVNAKGTVGEISPELRTLIRYLNGEAPGDEYTNKLNNEVTSIRSDEKWRHDFMTLGQKFREKEYIGAHKHVVRQVRKSSRKLSLPEMADLFDVPEDDCKEILTLLDAHPDWTDDEVADHVMWEEWK